MRKNKDELNQNQAESKKMIDKMSTEIRKIVDMYDKSEELRRMTLRTIFSAIEGTCYRLKLDAFDLGKLKNMHFSSAQIAFIKEESYFLTKGGKARTRRTFVDSKSNLRFAFDIFARALESGFELDVEGEDWQNYQEVLKIRHRITHPKNMSDLNISEEDYKNTLRAYVWFRESIGKAF